MEQENALSYDSIAMLLGKTILQNQLQLDQMGKVFSSSQEMLNKVKEENAMLRQQLAQAKANEQGTIDK